MVRERSSRFLLRDSLGSSFAPRAYLVSPLKTL